MDELYGLPLDRFTPERNALARELRNAGERERGAEVAALRKPSVAAWAVNQLVRTQKSAIGELFEAGDGLRHAHDEVLAGRGDGGSLRVAVERERQAVESLIQSAGGLLSTDGHELSPTIIDRVADTLHAAALDDDARVQLRDGRLERELRHVGLGMAAAGATPATAPTRRPTPNRALGRRPSRRRSSRPRSPPPIEGRPSAPCENGRRPRRRPARRSAPWSARPAGAWSVPSGARSLRASAATELARRSRRPKRSWLRPRTELREAKARLSELEQG